MADDDKTEDATPKRREESREKGQLGKSQDLTAALIIAIAIGFLYLYGYTITNFHFKAAHNIFSNINDIELSVDNLEAQGKDALFFVLKGMMPFMLVLFVAAILANITQFGLILTFKTLMPDFNKINPINGIKQKFSLKTVMMALMNTGKTLCIGTVTYMVLKSLWIPIFRLSGQDIRKSVFMFFDAFFQLSFYIILVIMILAIIDFAYQKWQNSQSMKMSKQEVKDEMKNMDGDPKIKQKRRQIQMQMSRQRMMKDVQDADVVITNPTHLSVAIKYDEATMRAPIVVAKGADLLALKIREIAKEHRVPLVENKPIAQSLYKTVEVGEPIPQKMFKAVAEILAYVFNINNKRQNTSR
jgi:flagellar biosynthetic protein FlhB